MCVRPGIVMAVTTVHLLAVILGVAFSGRIVTIGEAQIPAGGLFFPFAFAMICLVREVWQFDDCWRLVACSCSIFAIGLVLLPLSAVLGDAPGFRHAPGTLGPGDFVLIGVAYVAGEGLAAGIWHFFARRRWHMLWRLIASPTAGQLFSVALVWPVAYLGHDTFNDPGRSIMFRIVLALAFGGALSLVISKWSQWIREQEFGFARIFAEQQAAEEAARAGSATK